MAEGISIPVNIRPGDLSGLTAISRELEKTRRQLSLATEQATTPTPSEWEALPGGGIRRRGRVTQPGAGTYNTPPMIPSGARLPAAPASPAAAPSAPAPAVSLRPLSGRALEILGSQPPRSGISGVPSGTPAPGGPVTPATPFQQGTQAVRGYTQSLSQANQQASALHGTLQQLGRSATLGAATGAAVPPSTAGPRPLSGRALQLLSPHVAGGGAPPISPPRVPPRSPMPPVPPSSDDNEEEDEEEDAGTGTGTNTGTGTARRRRPNMAQRMLGRLRQGARTVLGVTAGVGIYQALTHAMSLYEQRAHGIVAVGMQLDQNFAQVGGTIDRLRTNYQVLAHDSIGAMQAMGQVTNRLAGLDQAVAFGAAYGIAAPTIGHMAGLAQRLTTGPNPLAAMGGSGSTLYGVNYQAMPMEPLIDEQLSMAQLGGQVGVRMPASYYGHMASMIGGMGEQMQVPGAISQFFGQYAQGLAQAPDEGIYAMRMQALVRLREQRQAQGKGTKLPIGDTEVDLASTFGMETAMEAAGFSPEVQEAFAQQIPLMTGGRPELAPRAFWNMMGGRQIGRLKSEQLRQSASKQPGGFPSLGRPGSAITGATEAVIEDRLGVRQQLEEFKPERARARVEPGMERFGEHFVRASTDLQQTLGDLAKIVGDNTFTFDKLKEAMSNLSAPTQTLLGILTLLGSSSTTGQILGGSLIATGALTGLANQGGEIGIGPGRFHLSGPLNAPIGMGTMPLVPQQQGQ